MRKPPCGKVCPKRTISPNCHDTCEEYIDWHNEVIAAKKYVKDSTPTISLHSFTGTARGARKSTLRL